MFLLRTLVRYVLRSQTNVKCYTTVESIGNKMENPLVTVKQGKLKGSVKRLLNGKTYYSFKGVPYAQPPVGDLRFKAPLPPLPWDGIKEAINHGPVCPQYNMTTTQLIEGSEDCLFLNVYTKTLDSNSKIPVMVYVHGGAFSSGSGDADILGPEFLLQHDVIIVTINYRLEVLGFLCLDTPEVPGNAGMKDQVAALRWVKENIAQFGGDPGNVTLFGESAGAGSVTYHMLSPMSKGLFHRAIAQSGVCLQDWAIVDGAKERAFRAGKLLGKDTNNTKELLDFLKNIPAIDFKRMSLRTRSQDEKYRGLPMLFVPVVEKKFHGVESFLTENPIDILMSGKINKVPLLIGYNSAEGLLMLEDQFKKLEIMNNKPSYYVPREIARKISQEQMEDFGARIKSFYVGNKELSKDTAQEIVDIQTDLHFSYHSHRFAHLYLSYAPVYMYRFNYMTGLSFLTNMLTKLQVKGTCHADDVFYLFYSELIKEPYQEDQKARDIVFQLTKFWTDFARTGNPTPDTCEVEWKRYTSAGKEYLALEDDLRIRHYADRDRMEFWNKVYRDAGLPYITKSAI